MHLNNCNTWACAIKNVEKTFSLRLLVHNCFHKKLENIIQKLLSHSHKNFLTMKIASKKAPTKETKSSPKQVHDRQVTYSPNSPWWEPPLSAWVPISNREIVFFYTIVIITMVLAARFTPFCGIPPEETNNFCSPGWMFKTDHILKFISAGMFFLVAFRANQSYAKWWEGRCMWGLIWKVSVSNHRHIMTDKRYHRRFTVRTF